MVGINPEKKVLTLDPIEAHWAAFGFTSEPSNPHRSTLLKAIKAFEDDDSISIFADEERIAGGKQVELPASPDLAAAVAVAIGRWMARHTTPQLRILSSHLDTPGGQLADFTSKLAESAVIELRQIAENLTDPMQ